MTQLAAGQVGSITALAPADEDAKILVWDALSCRRLLDLHAVCPLSALTFGTVDGVEVLAAAEQHGPIRVWDVLSGDELATLDTAGTIVTALTVCTHSGTATLMAGMRDKTVRAWQLPEGATRGGVSVEQTPLALSFSPPETLHVAGSAGLTTIHHFLP
ncbi:WD40 repeat domain-containing protein [Streptomyces sp. NPDC023588]|uniref:WD40 repeat domain-containing protein n=1 Tax=Streptomyces sp. NPDC023588 TaxID=3154907 RepID=UPI00340F2672